MAITTFTELKTAIANWTDRTDLTDRIPEFIALAESDIRTELNASQMEQRAYATASTTSPYLALPTDFLSMRRMQIAYGGIDYQVQERPASELSRRDSGATGLPKYYAIVGDQFQFHPQPDSEYRVEITYHKDVPALTDSNATNWVLDDYHNIYLFGALKHAQVYIKNTEEAAQSDALFRDALRNLIRQNRKRVYGGHPLQTRVV